MLQCISSLLAGLVINHIRGFSQGLKKLPEVKYTVKFTFVQGAAIICYVAELPSKSDCLHCCGLTNLFVSLVLIVISCSKGMLLQVHRLQVHFCSVDAV